MLIFRRYITVDGRRVYPKKSKAFPIWIDDDKVRSSENSCGSDDAQHDNSREE